VHVLERDRDLPPNLDLIKIGDSAFGGFMSLSEIALSPNLTEIGVFAFSGCTSLSEITLPPNLTEIGSVRLLRVQVLERDRTAAEPH